MSTTTKTTTREHDAAGHVVREVVVMETTDTPRGVTRTEAAARGVTLNLTRDEAEALLMVQRRVGGAPTGRRGHLDKIGEAIRAAGVHIPWGYDRTELSGGITFADA